MTVIDRLQIATTKDPSLLKVLLGLVESPRYRAASKAMLPKVLAVDGVERDGAMAITKCRLTVAFEGKQTTAVSKMEDGHGDEIEIAGGGFEVFERA